jgi:hypothetical protein
MSRPVMLSLLGLSAPSCRSSCGKSPCSRQWIHVQHVFLCHVTVVDVVAAWAIITFVPILSRYTSYHGFVLMDSCSTCLLVSYWPMRPWMLH